MIKTALITFHAPYNYGSCLQAYALQFFITKLGYENTIINYRFKGQRDAYKLIRSSNNYADYIKDILQLPIFFKKVKRKNKFEYFIARYLTCTKEYCEPEELSFISNDYDVFISGSDQIWNKHANELNLQPWKYLYPYLLSFTNKKKISYASSIGSTSDQEIIDHMVKYINDFSFISSREVSTANRLSGILDRKILSVVDPTLLLNKEDYISSFNLAKNNCKPYIFYYSLSGIHTVFNHLRFLKKFAKSHNYQIIINTPYAYIPSFGNVINYIDIGPIEFLSLIYNSSVVVTDSFHGTVFSLIFEKQFYSLCKNKMSADSRKIELLTKFNQEQCLLFEIENLNVQNKANYDDEHKTRFISEINKSKEYLISSLK